MNQKQIRALASALLFVAIVQGSLQVFASQHDQDQDDLAGPMMSRGANSRASAASDANEPDNEFGGSFTGPIGGYGDESSSASESQYDGFRPTTGSHKQQAQASENNENQADDEDANEDDDSAGGAEFELGRGGSRRAAMRALAENAQPWLESSQLGVSSEAANSAGESADIDGTLGADSNIANAKIEMSSQDRQTAAGHHHHHGHYVHGMLKMGAETGKKGAFKWHDKHPVGGKGRR